MFFTRAGLEQATRGVVARRRAARLVAAGVRGVADLGCGVGADTLAMAQAGLRVHAVDADPVTAAVAAANARALGLAELVTVSCGRAEDVDLSTVDAAFCDPARRQGGSRTFNPANCSPPWSFVTQLVESVPRTVLKLAPGIEHRLLPAGAQAEWVSVDGDLVEAAFWCGPLAGPEPHVATLLASADSPARPGEHALTGTGLRRAPVGPVRRYLYDPDAAVVRSHLVAEFAETVQGSLADPEIAYVYADVARDSPFGQCYEVTDALPFSLKGLRALLRTRGVGVVTIKKRGSALVPEELRRQLRLAGDGAATVVLTKVAGGATMLLCQPVPMK